MKHTVSRYLLLLSFLPLYTYAQETQTTSGLWQDLELTKVLPYDWAVSVEAGYRTTSDFNEFDRFHVGLGVSRKLSKYFKVSAGYIFMTKHFLEETTPHYSSSSGLYNGYNVDAEHWTPRHRAYFDIAADKRFWKTLRISLRERYQYTHQLARNVDRTKYRADSYDAAGNIVDWEDPETTIKEKSAKDRHLLRSRLKFAIDKKGWDWEPYVSAEIHNNLREDWHFDKIRASVGVDYSVSKVAEIGVAYIFTHENDDDGDENVHAVSVGYKYKF